MTRMYGHRWTSNYGERDDGTWARGLRGITAEQLGKGIQRILEPSATADGWPPTLPEFRAMCKQPQPKVENAAMYRIHSTLALPRPKPDYSKARPFLQTMKAAVNRSTTVSQSLAPQPEVGDETPAADERAPSG